MADLFSGGIMPQVIQNRQGLQNLDAQRQQMEAAQRQRQSEEEGTAFLQQYAKSVQDGKPDNNLLMQGVFKSPTVAQNALSAIGIIDKQQKTRAATDVVSLMSSVDNPQLFYKALAARIQNIKAAGGDPSDSIELGKAYQAGDIDSVKQALSVTGAALANEGFIRPEVIGLNAAGSQASTAQQDFNYYQQLMQTDPAMAEQFARSKGYVESGREQAQTTQERNLATYQQLLAEGNPNAESFGVSAGLLSKEGRELSANSQQEVTKSLDNAEANAVRVTRYIDLADRYVNSPITGGLVGTGGSWREGIKAALGMQDEEVTKIVSDWEKIRSGEAIASLPQGPATDADIRLALRPLPENANAEYMNMYLRGLAKTAAYKSEFDQARADFITEHGGLRTKAGKNFGNVWKEQRQAVLDSISKDPRFNVKKREAPPPPVPQIVPNQVVQVGEFTIKEVRR